MSDRTSSKGTVHAGTVPGGVPALPRVAELLYGRPLALSEAKAREIDLAVGDRVLAGAALELPEPNPPGAREQSIFDPERIEGGVAVLDVFGAMTNRGSWLRAASGMASYEAVRTALLDAATHQGVRGIVLRLDTPGGTVSGAFDLADDIRAISKEVPIYAAADDQATSAGYLLAAAAEKFYVTRTTMTGSIGVVLVHVDRSGEDEQRGLRRTILRSRELKARPSEYEQLTKRDRERLLAEMARFDAMFVEAVVGLRKGVTAAAIDEADGAVLNADEALELGLADKLGTVRDATAAMRRRIDGAAARSFPSPGRMEDQAGGDPEMKETEKRPDAAPSADRQTEAADPAIGREILGAAKRYGVDSAEVLGAAAEMADDAAAVGALQQYAIVKNRMKATDFVALVKPGMSIEALRDAVVDYEARQSRAEDVETAVLPHEGARDPGAKQGRGGLRVLELQKQRFQAQGVS